MGSKQPKWKASSGYAINPLTGVAERCENSACTLHFYLAASGDRLHLLDDRYEYAVALYSSEIEPRYIYTYDYQPEESWTTYRQDSLDSGFAGEDYMFSEKTFFRVVIRKKSCGSTAGNKEDNQPEISAFSEVLEWQRVQKYAGGSESSASMDISMDVCTEISAEITTGAPAETTTEAPAEIATEVSAEIEATVRTVKEKQAGETLNFLLMTDTHYTVNGTWDDTVRHLYRTVDGLKTAGVGLDGLIHLGDATDGLVQAEITRDYVSVMQEDIRGLGLPVYYVLGNHDSNYFRNNPERFSEEEIRELYLGGRERSYYYQDFEKQCLRMIFLDSFDPREKIRYGFHEEELDWLEDILRLTPSGWYVVIYSHVPPMPRLHYWSKEIRGSGRLLRILRNFQEQTYQEQTYQEQACQKQAYEEASLDKEGKSKSCGKLLGFIHGHNHADQIDYQEGFPIISIGCNKCEYFEDKKPEGAVTYKRTLGTYSQDLWDVLVISVKDETLDFIRFGAGESRHVMSGEQRIAPSASVPRDGIRELSGGICENRGAGVPMKKVITYGTFDLFHEGHYNILKRAKALGDYLIVGVTTEHYDEQRGKLNIVDSLLERIENVRRTGLVDEIIIEDHEGQKIEDVQKYGVDVFALGSDWKGVFDYLKQYCHVVYLERTPDISSTMLRSGKFPIIRIGIVGTGRIAPRFIAEAKYVSGLNVQCVYNPHRESAEAFAAGHFLESYSGDFERFLDAVDAIYIASPHETHYDYTKRALAAGKHVLCEKPMAFSRSETEELFSLAREKQLVLMEGIKTAYCPGFAQLVSIAKSGKIGEIRDVEACFSRLTAPHLREMADARYGGAFLEFGSYTVLPIVKMLGGQYEKIKISSILAENGVDLYTKIYFDYPEGMATSKTGVGVKSEGQLLISGTKGYILAESPWWLTKKFQVRYEDPDKIETYTPNFLGDGLRYEIGEFAMRINGRGGHPFKLTEEETLAMAGVVECFMKERRRQQGVEEDA